MSSGLPYRDGQSSVDTEIPLEALPNFDCIHDVVENFDEVADDYYHMAAMVYEDINVFGYAIAEMVHAGLSEFSPEFRMQLRQLGKTHLPSLEGHIRSEHMNRFSSECPYGDWVLRFSIWTACRFLVMPATADEVKYWQLHPGAIPEAMASEDEFWPNVCYEIRSGLTPILTEPLTLTTALNSNWIRPFCFISFSARQALRQPPASPMLDPFFLGRTTLEDADCQFWMGQSAPSGVRWMSFLKALTDEASGFFNGGSGLPSNWLEKVLPFAINDDTFKKTAMKLQECPLGYASMQLINLVVAQTAKTEQYLQIRDGLSANLRIVEGRPNVENIMDSMSYYMLSKWPIIPLMCTLSRGSMGDTVGGRHGYQHKPFSLDFLRSEILRSRSVREDLTLLRNSDREIHTQHLLSASSGASITFAELLRALVLVLTDWEPGHAGINGQKLVFVTVVWGRRLARYLPGVLKRAKAFGLLHRYIIFCLDEDALETCKRVHDNCVSGHKKTMYNTYAIISALVHMGFDALYLDFDTLLVRDPTPFILKAAEASEIAVSRDFGSECLNTGVTYFKAHPHVGEFLASLLVWLWHHPYEFSQKAFSAFLGHEKSVDDRMGGMPLQQVPRWSILDPMNAFVTSSVYNYGVEGWTGSLDGIAIFHFLDGTGGVDADRALQGKYMNLYDLFYDNDKIDLLDPETPLWVQDPRIEQEFLRSRLPGPPETLVPCMMLPDSA